MVQMLTSTPHFTRLDRLEDLLTHLNILSMTISFIRLE